MNRGFLIILIPAFLVASGYIVIFRYVGVTPDYVRLAGAMIGGLSAATEERQFRRQPLEN